jgi:hypothetical protein
LGGCGDEEEMSIVVVSGGFAWTALARSLEPTHKRALTPWPDPMRDLHLESESLYPL